jgi:hypothetical protein
MTFEYWLDEEGVEVNENQTIVRDLIFTAKYHNKRIVFDIGDQVLYDGYYYILEDHYVEVIPNSKFFTLNSFKVEEHDGYFFSCWNIDGKPFIQQSGIDTTFYGDLIVEAIMLKFEYEFNNNTYTLKKYIDDKTDVHLPSTASRFRNITYQEGLFDDFKDIRYFSYEKIVPEGILKGQENLEELYPMSYTIDSSKESKITLKYLYASDSFDNIAPNLKTVYASPEYKVNPMYNYSFDGFCERTVNKYDLILLNQYAGLCEIAAQGLIAGARTIILNPFNHKVDKLFAGCLGENYHGYQLEYLVVPETVTYIHENAFYKTTHPIYFELDRDTIVKNNTHNHYYENHNRERMFYRGEWKYDDNGVPTPLIEK